MSDFVYREPGKVIRDILLAEMGLEPGQIMFTNQKYPIPTTGIYIAISYLGPSRVISRQSELVPDGTGGMLERQSAVTLDAVQLDIMAYNDPAGGNPARARAQEITMALASILSQQLQEKYAMQIARNPGNFQDTSFLEETEMITRYTVLVMTTSVNRKEKASTEYYDTFPGAAVYPNVSDAPIIPILAPPVNPLTV